jgi:RsiW-degrading membrane proteinase PrsW (M82 family)
METILMLIAAIAQAVVLVYYIYKKDKLKQEPPKELLKAFGLGVLSVFVSLGISLPLKYLAFYTNEPHAFWEGVCAAFCGAAIPEEIAKFLMFWLVVRKNRWFDEKMDGVVYASCVALGFAALENILYLASNFDAWVSVGIARALLSVPGHFFFGILMGYYYSLVRFSVTPSMKNKCMVLLAPILAHGIYNSLLFTMDIVPSLSLVLMVVFLFGVNKLRKIAVKKAEQHLMADASRIDNL